MSSTVELHKKLLDEWSKDATARNLSTVEKLIDELKAQLCEPEASSLEQKAYITIHRDLYEISALSAALREDMPGFDDAIQQAMSFYATTPGADSSENKLLMVGLYLMFLVASNRLSQFHMLLEQISQEVQKTNPYISIPVTIEQSLMEGAYNKVALSEKNIPSPYFVPFFRVMADAVRSEIAGCMSKSFKKVLTADAVNLLIFKTPQEVLAFAAKQGWRVSPDGSLIDVSGEVTAPASSEHRPTLDSSRIAQQTIFYAKQLEKIV